MRRNSRCRTATKAWRFRVYRLGSRDWAYSPPRFRFPSGLLRTRLPAPMKAFFTALAVSAIFITTASADWVIESKIESPQMNSATTTKVKGDKLRVDIPNGPAGAMSSIIDTKSGESIQILHSQKMAMKTTAGQLKQAMDAAKQAAGVKSGGPA